MALFWSFLSLSPLLTDGLKLPMPCQNGVVGLSCETKFADGSEQRLRRMHRTFHQVRI